MPLFEASQRAAGLAACGNELLGKVLFAVHFAGELSYL